MAESVGIVGGGLIGRLLGLELARMGRAVTLLDRGSCAFAGDHHPEAPTRKT
jgi:2-polyprenyl-6-methoxyphenol hydroxylase-like FAD-dependent oxidoreductase